MKKSNRNNIGLKSGFALRISDDSMRDANIQNGDAVFVRVFYGKPRNGMFICVRLFSKLIIRKYRIKDDTVTLEACSPNHINIEFDFSEELEILGEAIGIIEGI